jgi:Ser/Thr protein kinase RdoA (MazF antagonist)
MNRAIVPTGLLAHKDALEVAYTRLSTGEAAELLYCGFEVEGRLSPLATEKDDTFRVDAADRRRYVLKVANPSEDPAEIALQIELLLHLARVDATIPVPRLIRNRDGHTSFTKVDRAGQNRCVRLMS